MNYIISKNPANQETIGRIKVPQKNEIEAVVTTARTAFEEWRNVSVKERSSYVKRFQKLIIESKHAIASIISLETGMPYDQAMGDIEYDLQFIDYYLNIAPQILEERKVRRRFKTVAKISYEPLGVCVTISPWNYPFQMFTGGVIPALLMGNTVVFKASELSTLSHKMIFDIFMQTSMTRGVVQFVAGDKYVAKNLMTQNIDFVKFTGSTEAGLEVYKQCANKFIPCLLELGGSSPAIIFPDCDLSQTVAEISSGRFLNTGQSCVATKRIFVHEGIINDFLKKLIDRVKTLQVGDPFQKVDIGPVISVKQYKKLTQQVEDAKRKGAKVVIGGKRPKGKKYQKGNYYLPTVLIDVTTDMKVMNEEVFGPVLPIMTFKTEKEAEILANATPFGLSAEVYSRDQSKAVEMSKKIQAGIVSLNTHDFYQPFIPIGGFKKSGLGRQFGAEGFLEYVQIKSTYFGL